MARAVFHAERLQPGRTGCGEDRGPASRFTERNLTARDGRRTPVTMAVTYRAGVSSKAGLYARTPAGAMRRPMRWVTSRPSRSSIGISFPERIAGSMVEQGAAT